MPLLRDEAEKLSNNMLLQGVIEEIITEDEMWNLVPLKPVQGKAYVYDRELSLSEPDFLSPNDSVNEGAATFIEVTARVRALIGDVDVDQFLQQVNSDTNNQEAIQIALKAKALSRKWRNTMINGSEWSATWTSEPAGFITATQVSAGMGSGTLSLEIDIAPSLRVRLTAPNGSAGSWVLLPADGTYTVRDANTSKYVVITVDVSECGAADSTATATIAASKEFTGLKYLVDPSQELAAATNGAVLSFDLLDELLDMVKTGPVSALIMPKRTIRAYKALLRGAGGIEPAMIELENFGKPVLSYSGVPILCNDYISTAETQGSSSTCTSVYAAFFNENAGVCGLAGGKNAGFVIEDVGIVQNKDAKRTRVKQYGGMAVHSTLSLARLKGVTN